MDEFNPRRPQQRIEVTLSTSKPSTTFGIVKLIYAPFEDFSPRPVSNQTTWLNFGFGVQIRHGFRPFQCPSPDNASGVSYRDVRRRDLGIFPDHPVARRLRLSRVRLASLGGVGPNKAEAASRGWKFQHLLVFIAPQGTRTDCLSGLRKARVPDFRHIVGGRTRAAIQPVESRSLLSASRQWYQRNSTET